MTTNKRGRPSLYSPELAQQICDLIADGSNLDQIAKKDGFPPACTVRDWLVKYEDFSMEYARARKARADARSDRIDKYKRMTLKGKIPADVARIAIDAEKWQAGKENSSRYGDLTKIDHTGSLTLEQLVTQSLKPKSE